MRPSFFFAVVVVGTLVNVAMAQPKQMGHFAAMQTACCVDVLGAVVTSNERSQCLSAAPNFGSAALIDRLTAICERPAQLCIDERRRRC